MNIFATSACPQASAKFLDDKRVVKMVLESAQLLSNVMNMYGAQGPYKLTHKYHPCTKWAMENRTNARWLFAHFVFLCNEYTARYGKTHKCEELLPQFKAYFGTGDISVSNFLNCTPYPELPVHEAYQQCLSDKWDTDKRPATWYKKERVS